VAHDAGSVPVLLLGASTGVYHWPANGGEAEQTFVVDGAADVQGGFNAATLIGDRMVASHSELGLCEWTAAEPGSPRRLFTSMTCDAQTVRAVQAYDGELYCAIDNRIIRWPGEGQAERPDHIYTGSMSNITALCISSEGVFAGNRDGDILHWQGDHTRRPERLHTGLQRAAESIWVVPTHGVQRLVYADTSLHIHSRVLGDDYSCRYEAGGQTLRRVEVAPDLLVATNDRRDRLIYWKPGEPRQPAATVNVAQLCGNSIQDVCLVPVA